MNKKLYVGLLGYNKHKLSEIIYANIDKKIININSFNPLSDEYYWKILKALNISQSMDVWEHIDNTMDENPPTELHMVLWYNTHRKEVLEAVEQVLEKK